MAALAGKRATAHGRSVGCSQPTGGGGQKSSEQVRRTEPSAFFSCAQVSGVGGLAGSRRGRRGHRGQMAAVIGACPQKSRGQVRGHNRGHRGQSLTLSLSPAIAAPPLLGSLPGCFDCGRFDREFSLHAGEHGGLCRKPWPAAALVHGFGNPALRAMPTPPPPACGRSLRGQCRRLQ